MSWNHLCCFKFERIWRIGRSECVHLISVHLSTISCALSCLCVSYSFVFVTCLWHVWKGYFPRKRKLRSIFIMEIHPIIIPYTGGWGKKIESLRQIGLYSSETVLKIKRNYSSPFFERQKALLLVMKMEHALHTVIIICFPWNS